MSKTSKTIVGLVLSVLLSILLIWSALMKFFPNPAMIKGIYAMGLTPFSIKIIGVIEIISLILFIIPRTGILGTLLLTAYLGGAIATHLTHGQSIYLEVIAEAILWIAATIRFSDLSRKLSGNKRYRSW